jgi:hypothetical protein
MFGSGQARLAHDWWRSTVDIEHRMIATTSFSSVPASGRDENDFSNLCTPGWAPAIAVVGIMKSKAVGTDGAIDLRPGLTNHAGCVED